MSARARIPDDARRARLVRRHHLGRTAPDVTSAVRDLVAFHSSDPITPHLAARARVPRFQTRDLDTALLEDRTLWRLHAMRRTLFIVPTDAAHVVEAAAGRKIASRERRRVRKWLASETGHDEADGWLARVSGEVLDALSGGERRTAELRDAVPAMSTEITLGSGKWARRAPVASRVLYLLAMEQRIVRTRAAGSWRSSQYYWSAATDWFGKELRRIEPAEGRAELARRYLAAFGPATEEDLRWWAGWTKTRTRAALKAVDVASVELDSDREGFVLAEDLEVNGPPSDAAAARPGSGRESDRDTAPPETGVAFLPGLDPTPMGWKERTWYLGAHETSLFDANGNVGPTIWLEGRIVGGWGQRVDGSVAWRLLEDVGREAARRVEAEAAILERWLDGEVVVPRFRTPLERELAEGG